MFANHADEPGELQANLCGGTRAGGAPAALGDGRAPQAEPGQPAGARPGPITPGDESNSGTLLIILGVAIIAAAVMIAVR